VCALFTCDETDESGELRALNYFIDEVGVFGCLFVLKGASPCHDLRRKLSEKT